MSPRLPDADVIATAQMLTAAEVTHGDIRLGHISETGARNFMASNAAAKFVTWPDASIGFVLLPPTDMDGRDAVLAVELLAVYASAREYLEWLNLQLFNLIAAPAAH